MIGNAILHFIKCNLGLEVPHSQTTKAEQLAIAKYSKGVNKAIEIGVYEGVNTVIIAKNISEQGTLFAIDPFFKGRLGICYHEKIAKHYVKKNGLTSKINFIPKLSFDAVNDVPNDIDFIFVDGDHSLDGIKKDWEFFSEKLPKGGIIALHDTSVPKHNPSIAKLGSCIYFNSTILFDSRFKLLETVDSLNILCKL